MLIENVTRMKSLELRHGVGLTEWMGADPRAAAAAILTCVAGSLIFPMVPVLVDALTTTRPDLTTQQIGLIASADTFGMFLGAFATLAMVARFDVRKLALAALTTLLAGNVTAMFAQGFVPLLAARLCAGAAGGVMMAVGLATIGATGQPDRNYALTLVLQTVSGSALIWINAHWFSRFGIRSVLVLVSAIALVMSVAIPWLRMTRRRAPSQTSPEPPRSFLVVPFVCLTFFAWGVSLLMVWAYVQVIGRSFGLTTDEVGASVSFGLIGGAVGSMIGVITGVRFGRLVPTMAFALVYLFAVTALLHPKSALMFAAVAFAFQATANIGVYPFGALSLIDRSGRLAVAYLLSLKAGFGVGPALGAHFVHRDSYAPVIKTGAMLSTAAFLMFLALILIAQRGLRGPRRP